MTKIYNKNSFVENVLDKISHSKSIILNKNLKEINNVSGHSIGDEYKINILQDNNVDTNQKADRIDKRILINSDLCVIVTKNGEIVHHTCVALKSPFDHPRTIFPIDIKDETALIYNVKTLYEFRGEGIAPGVFHFLSEKLGEMGIKSIYTFVSSGNSPSIRSFKKIGFIQSGSINHMSVFNKHFVVNLGQQLYYRNPIFSYKGLRFYFIKKNYDGLPCIQNYVKNYKREGETIALYGAGSHTRRLTKDSNIQADDILCVFDDDHTKHGETFELLNAPIVGIDKCDEFNPDVIIISSKAYHDSMLSRLKRISLPKNKIKILHLYPEIKEEIL